jgi:hypothetical protein
MGTVVESSDEAEKASGVNAGRRPRLRRNGVITTIRHAATATNLILGNGRGEISIDKP